MSTPTPRTDANAITPSHLYDCGFGDSAQVVAADFARQLEREAALAHVLAVALDTADNDIVFARGLIAEGQPADALRALNDAQTRIRFALSTYSASKTIKQE